MGQPRSLRMPKDCPTRSRSNSFSRAARRSAGRQSENLEIQIAGGQAQVSSRARRPPTSQARPPAAAISSQTRTSTAASSVRRGGPGSGVGPAAGRTWSLAGFLYAVGPRVYLATKFAVGNHQHSPPAQKGNSVLTASRPPDSHRQHAPGHGLDGGVGAELCPDGRRGETRRRRPAGHEGVLPQPGDPGHHQPGGRQHAGKSLRPHAPSPGC